MANFTLHSHSRNRFWKDFENALFSIYILLITLWPRRPIIREKLRVDIFYILHRNAWNRILWIYQCSHHLSKSPTYWGLVHCADAVIFWVGVCNCNWHPPPNWCTKCGSFFLEIYGMSKLSWFSTRYTIHKRWLADFSIQNGVFKKRH